MKITRDIIDNGMHIVHIEYTKAEIADAIRKAKEHKELIEKGKQKKDGTGADTTHNAS